MEYTVEQLADLSIAIKQKTVINNDLTKTNIELESRNKHLV